MFANSISDIFTEPDESIFSDGSIDPMGLRIIWTSMGNKIFGNRLNTISTDIRFFTLNLFHHSIIATCEKEFEEQISTLVGTTPYNNLSDLEDGLVIFLECLMTHSLLESRQKMRDGQIGMIPGMSKLRTKIDGRSQDKMVIEIEVNRSKGILIRHHLLGIHGRHKNPFREMKIFGNVNYYQNREIWKEVEQIFSVQPWRKLRDKLIELIGQRVLSARPNGTSYLKMKVNEPGFNQLIKELEPLYFACLQPSVFRTQSLVRFWEARLGLLEGTAYLLYSELKKNVSELSDNEWPDYSAIIKSAEKREADKEGAQLKAICAIEPLLACFEKVSNRLLARRTSNVNDLIPFIDNWRKSNTISVNTIQPFLREEFMDLSALKRLKELLNIFSSSVNSKEFIEKVIDYHKKIMNERGALPWVSISKDGDIKHHRPYYFTTDQLARLALEEWVNAYYLPTVFRIYKGLYTN